jgi:ribosomal protein L11 methylase PrmA
MELLCVRAVMSRMRIQTHVTRDRMLLRYLVLVVYLSTSHSFNYLCRFNYNINQLRRLHRHEAITDNLANQIASDNREVVIGSYRIISSDNNVIKSTKDINEDVIYLNNIKEGWGDGKHPTTRLCLEFIDEFMRKDSNKNSKVTLLDYGTGSGILSIFAAKMNVNKCLGVEVDESSIASAATNVALNNVTNVVEVIHTARIYIGNEDLPIFDVTIANILPGALARIVFPIWGLTKPGGTICLSGLRPNQLEDIRR